MGNFIMRDVNRINIDSYVIKIKRIYYDKYIHAILQLSVIYNLGLIQGWSDLGRTFVRGFF